MSKHLLPGVERPALDADTLNGMLKGFIDLAFEHQGRFYVLDWKSNYLGPNDSAYEPEALRLFAGVGGGHEDERAEHPYQQRHEHAEHRPAI